MQRGININCVGLVLMKLNDFDNEKYFFAFNNAFVFMHLLIIG